MGMKISTADIDWQGQATAAFKYRLEFELLDAARLEVPDSDLNQLVSDWSRQWHYTPKLTNGSSVKFRPNELPPELSIWNLPCSDPPPGMRV